jgi:hypothetical protein
MDLLNNLSQPEVWSHVLNEERDPPTKKYQMKFRKERIHQGNNTDSKKNIIR